MTTFTREQVLQIEAAAKEVLWPVVWIEKKARAHFSEKITPEVVMELARIALASLEAEAVAYIIQDKTDRKEGNRGELSFRSVEQYYEEDINEHELTATLLYTAAPALVDKNPLREFAMEYIESWELGMAGDSSLLASARKAIADSEIIQSAPVSVPDDYFSSLVAAARVRADKAMRKFPQPNYVLNKVAEESGEVIKAVIHFTEGREEWQNVEGEIIDNLAMLIRLVMEGDQVIGFTPPDDCRAAMLQGSDGNSPAGWVACSERMPEEGSKVIVFRPRADESNDPPVKTATYKGGREYYHGFDCYCEPTHWMPLPAAPNQEVE